MLALFVLKALFDIVLISFVIYRLLLLTRDARVGRVLIFITGIVAISLLASFLRLPLTEWVFESFTTYIVLVIIILFQPEIRRAILSIPSGFWFARSSSESPASIDEIISACRDFSRTRTGALIVIQRSIDLGQILTGGVEVGGKVSKEMLLSIFQRTSPLHDGAVIIRDGRIWRAACVLPVSPRKEAIFGLRHKAALGITEETDAVAVVVSETTGRISYAERGEMRTTITFDELKTMLKEALK